MGVVIAVGLDVVDLDRFRAAVERTPGLLDRLFTAGERTTAAERRDPIPSLAARFAAGADPAESSAREHLLTMAVVEAAYNDAAGLTAEFTLNLLHRLNRDLGCDFDPGGFAHRARYLRDEGRIVTTLESLREQVVTVEGRAFAFARGEHMHVEQSQKYTDARIAALADRAGLRVVDGWNDPRDWFGLRLLRAA